MKKHKLTGEGGKGSVRRTTNDKAYADGWEAIFGKKKKQPQDPDYDPADTEWEDLKDD